MLDSGLSSESQSESLSDPSTMSVSEPVSALDHASDTSEVACDSVVSDTSSFVGDRVRVGVEVSQYYITLVLGFDLGPVADEHMVDKAARSCPNPDRRYRCKTLSLLV